MEKNLDFKSLSWRTHLSWETTFGTSQEWSLKTGLIVYFEYVIQFSLAISYDLA